MAKIRAVPSQEFVKVEAIKKGTIILQGGSLRKILAVDGLNLDLKSQEEVAIITDRFQAFLNSLDFSLEIIVHSRQMGLTNYIKRLQAKLKKQKNELLEMQLREYIEFLKKLGTLGNIMKKEFFVVVPYDSAIVSKKGIFRFLKFSSKKEENLSSNENFESMNFQLDQRVEMVSDSLREIGLDVLVLETKQIIRLLYNLYNPEIVERLDLEVLKAVN